LLKTAGQRPPDARLIIMMVMMIPLGKVVGADIAASGSKSAAE
jgi:hypothetical protein